MSPLLAAAASIHGFLADGGDSPSDVDPTTGKGPEWGEAAPIGLLVIVLLCIAVYFLVKSMNRNLKKVPESFAMAGAPAPAAGGAVAGGSPTLASADDAAAPSEGTAAGPESGSGPPADPR